MVLIRLEFSPAPQLQLGVGIISLATQSSIATALPLTTTTFLIPQHPTPKQPFGTLEILL